MPQPYLKKISLEDKVDKNIWDMMQGIDKNENGFINNGFGMNMEEFGDYVQKLYHGGIKPESGKVAQTVFWLFDNNEVIGYSKMRHGLTDNLKIRGGHIGYGIKKEKRGMGYGKIILNLTLNELFKIGVDKALLTCDQHNIASKKVIESCGGIMEDIKNGICRYWIDKEKII